MNNDIDHLSDWQIEELLIDSFEARGRRPAQDGSGAPDPARLHLENCPLCRSKRKHLEEALLLYREAALLKAEDAVQRAIASSYSMAARETQSFSAYRVFWGWPARAFAFLLLLVVLIPAFVSRERERHQEAKAAANHLQQERARDDLLLQQVDQEITESVPQPMQSLTQPVLDYGSKDE